MYSSDLSQMQYFSWQQLNYTYALLDLIQSKQINKYEESQRELASYHEQNPIKLDHLQKLFKLCQEVTGEVPTDDNKANERRQIVENNLRILKEVNEDVGVISVGHPRESLRQSLCRKKQILRLVHYGMNLEEEKYYFQQKAQILGFEKDEIGKYFNECMYQLKGIVGQKLDVFNTELFLDDVSIYTGDLLDCVRTDLVFTKKVLEICKEINNKIFICRKNVEKCNQRDLTQIIDQELARIQTVQFKALKSLENSVTRIFISLQQTIDSLIIKNIKINSKKKAVLDELTNLIRANSEYQSYLPSTSEGTQLGKSFKLLIETYFKEYLK